MSKKKEMYLVFVMHEGKPTEGVAFDGHDDAFYTINGHYPDDKERFGVPTLGEEFREAHEDDEMFMEIVSFTL